MAIKLPPLHPLLTPSHSYELMKLNQLPAGWKHSTWLTEKKNEPMNMVLANYWYKNLCSGYTWARKIERGTVYSLSAWCVCHILETTSYLGSFGAFFFYSLWAELYCIKISGWPKSLLGLFHSILWKKPNEIFDQPSNSSSLPLLKSISFLFLLFFFLKSAEASYHGIRTWRALES